MTTSILSHNFFTKNKKTENCISWVVLQVYLTRWSRLVRRDGFFMLDVWGILIRTEGTEDPTSIDLALSLKRE